jgi:N-acetylglucosaminyl-diphospho-decaprenol L-rhamnosyltransferase
MTRVAVVTVSYGSADVLEGFLESVATAAEVRPLVVVADNRPDWDRRAEIERLAEVHGARYLPMERNLGYGGAMNAAVATLPAAVDLVLLSNPDVVLSPGALDRLAAVAEESPSIASVGPRILESDGSTYPSARAVPSVANGIGHALFAGVWPTNPWTRAYRADDDAQAPSRRDAGWLSGACVLVRRSAFEAIGGFDEGYFMYFEDVDLGYRLGRAGGRNVYAPEASILHTGAHSTAGDESARMLDAHHRSARRFLSIRYSGVLLWPVRTALGLGLSVRSALVRRRAAARHL